MGLAQAKTIAASFIVFTQSGLITPGPGLESARQTSTSFKAISIPPVIPSGLVIRHNRHLSRYSSFRSSMSFRPG